LVLIKEKGSTHSFVGLAQSIWSSCDEIKENFHKCRLLILIWGIVMHARTSIIFLGGNQRSFFVICPTFYTTRNTNCSTHKKKQH
jgi:hypothetical protein